jgi:hypothetical protein
VPNISLADNGVGIMCDYDETLGGDLQVGGKILDGLERYSTTEQVIGKWINNKPVYRKVINFGALPNSTTKNVNHNIANVSQWVTIRGIFQYNGSVVGGPIPNTNTSDNTYAINITANATTVNIQTGIDRTSYSAYVILEYIKTTD